jgi:nucleoside-diphosphate-sugar epimerase
MVQLVLGATGSLGSAIVNELTSSGRPVRALVRNPSKAKKVLTNSEKLESLEGDIEDPQTLKRAFDGVDLFYNCMNVPYSQWQMLPVIHKRILDVAAGVRARMVFPGNVYIYGHAQTAKVSEDHPRNPCSKKGRIRLELENTFMQSSKECTVPCVIVRFPDYYGPNAASIADGIFKSAIKNKKARWYGKLDVMHEFIFISDAAKVMITASERADAFGQDFNVPGPEPIQVREWISLVFQQPGFPPKMTGTSRTFV